jgi:hypothetical protein
MISILGSPFVTMSSPCSGHRQRAGSGRNFSNPVSDIPKHRLCRAIRQTGSPAVPAGEAMTLFDAVAFIGLLAIVDKERRPAVFIGLLLISALFRSASLRVRLCGSIRKGTRALHHYRN